MALNQAQEPGRVEDPLEPLPPQAWGPAEAAHLLRRAGFGGPPEEVAELASLGPGAAVDSLVDFPPEEPELEAELASHGSALAVRETDRGMRPESGLEALRSWWLYRMARTRHPLREKLALYWHGHFACAASKVGNDALILDQNELFRRLGAASFRELLLAVAADPAMLAFLDNRVSRKEHPNENWARELMELFTLGVDRYTQEDVREVARAFTGWTTPEPGARSFAFDPRMHDEDDKRIFGARLAGRRGQRGVDEGREVIERILLRPECAEFLAGKLAAFFCAGEVPPRLASALAARLRSSGGSVREALRALFASRAFYAPGARFRLVKSPVELAAGAMRVLGVQNPHLVGLAPRLARMGQELFEPPSVAGWHGGVAWVQSASLLERSELARELSELPHTRRSVAGAAAYDVNSLAGEARANAELVDALAERLLQRQPPEPARAALAAYLDQRFGGAPAAGAAERRARVRALVQLLLAAPEAALA
jgi:uncharacterized protein (DUF1800 family)